MKIEVYTDGSATTADKPGGYGWVIVLDGKKDSEGSGYMELASNNDAELEAAIQGLAAVKKVIESTPHLFGILSVVPQSDSVTLVSDSQIILGWANGQYAFKQENKISKYKELQLLVNIMHVQTRWIEGHTGDEHNERCDKLANAARLGTDVNQIKPKKKKVIVKENKVTVNYKVIANRSLMDDFACEALTHANEGKYEPGSNYWRMMFIDKFQELLDNGNYFSIEKEE